MGRTSISGSASKKPHIAAPKKESDRKHGKRGELLPNDPPSNPRIRGRRSHWIAQRGAAAYSAASAETTAQQKECRIMDLAIGLIAAAVQFVVGVMGW
jgi:hypothetical protein